MDPPSRRDLIRLVGGAVGAGLVPVNFLGCGVGGARVVNSSYIPTPEAPLTPNALFYINYNFGLPDLPDRRAWRLHVQGMVENRLALSLDDLARFPSVTRELTLECIGNVPGGGLISSAAFEGVRLRDVMNAAGVERAGHGLRFLGLDGYPVYLPRYILEEDGVMLARAMNGEALDVIHGAPVRLLAPGRHGMFSCKWLDSITVARNYHAYGALRGLGNFVEGTTAVRSRVDAPGDGRTARVGEEVVVTGLAVTPGTGVARVEVHVEGEWREAELTFNSLSDDRSAFLWSLWRLRWTPRAPGTHRLSVRAWDTRGGTQNADPGFPYDSGAVHTVRVVVHQ